MSREKLNRRDKIEIVVYGFLIAMFFIYGQQIVG